MNIFFSVGEPSGDQHAAHLMTELREREPGISFSGFGGPLMEQGGCVLLYQLTNLAVMGVLRVIPLLWQFYRLVRQAGQYFRDTPPDAVVLVDFPGFNWWIARKAKAAGIPVFYYLPPQLWAWAPWRIRKMQKFVDYVLCALPFEPEWYAERGMRVDFVGHPFFDEVAETSLDPQFASQWHAGPVRNVGILPGSRTQEVVNNFPHQLRTMRDLHRKHPDVRFLVACYKPAHRELCEKLYAGCGYTVPVHFFVGKTPEIIQHSTCCLMVSGSISLELLARGTPAVVIYSCGRVFEWIGRRLVKLNSITLPNLIARKTILPEFLIVGDPTAVLQEVLGHLDTWLSQPAELARKRAELADLYRQVGQTGASSRAAELILQKLADRRDGKIEHAA